MLPCRPCYCCCQSLSHVKLFVSPWTLACQAPLSSTISQSLLRFMSIELVTLSNHLILCWRLLLLPSQHQGLKSVPEAKRQGISYLQFPLVKRSNQVFVFIIGREKKKNMHLSVVSTFFEVGSLNYTLGYISLYFLALGLPRARGLYQYLHISVVLNLAQTKIQRDLIVIS